MGAVFARAAHGTAAKSPSGSPLWRRLPARAGPFGCADRAGAGNTAALAALLFISWQTLALMFLVNFAARFLSHSSFVAMRVSLVELRSCWVGALDQGGWRFSARALVPLFFTTHGQRRWTT